MNIPEVLRRGWHALLTMPGRRGRLVKYANAELAKPSTIYEDESTLYIGVNTDAPLGLVHVYSTSTSTSYLPRSIIIENNSASVRKPALLLYKNRGGAVVQSGDGAGSINAYGYDGANYILLGQITFEVDGTPGTNDMPGRMIISTTADGGSTLTERLRIDSAGGVTFASGIGLYGTAPSAQSTGWAVTNVTTDKVFDADATSTAEIADVLGTLITELKAKGLLGA